MNTVAMHMQHEGEARGLYNIMVAECIEEYAVYLTLVVISLSQI